MESKIVTVTSNLFNKSHTKSIRFKFYFSGRNAKDFGLFIPILNDPILLKRVLSHISFQKTKRSCCHQQVCLE